MYLVGDTSTFEERASLLRVILMTPNGEKTAGQISLNLAEFVNSSNAEHVLNKQLEKCPVPGAMLSFIVKCVRVSDVMEIAEPESMMTINASKMAEISVMDEDKARELEPPAGARPTGLPVREKAAIKATITRTHHAPADESHDLLSKLEELRKENETLRAKHEKSKSDYERQMNDYIDELSSVREKLDKASFDVAEKEMVIARLNTELTKANEKSTQNEGMSSKHQEEVQALRKSLAEAQSALNLSQEDADTSQKQLSSLKKTLESVQEELRNEKARAEKLSVYQERDSAEGRVTSLGKEMILLKTALDQKSNELKDVIARVDELQREYAMHKELEKRFSTEISEGKQRELAMERELNVLRAQKKEEHSAGGNASKEDLEKVRENYEKQLKMLSRTVEIRDRTIRDLESEKRRLEEATNTAKANPGKTDEDENLQEKVQELIRANAILENDLVKAKIEWGTADLERENMGKTMKRLEERTKQTEMKMRVVEEELVKTKQRLGDIVNQIAESGNPDLLESVLNTVSKK
eukprot:TRINITY_DN3849_c0_g1_i4.p1 TRINITY_DN3849_c0_g1~~TRINITY_DN3849_c0_g1_i4.p1  ORF type:complete len:528 (+),score=158.68 TRINITY_DN3849_c0_g1_i4:229-1812(+)